MTRPQFVSSFPLTMADSIATRAELPSPRRKMAFVSPSPRRRNSQREFRAPFGESDAQNNFSQTAPTSPRASTPRRSYSQRIFNLMPQKQQRCQEATARAIEPKEPEFSAEIVELKECALAERPLCGIEECGRFNDIIFALAYDRKRFAAQKEFAECEKCNKAIDYVKEYQEIWRKTTAKQDREEKNESLNQKFKNDLEEFDRDTEAQSLYLNDQIEEDRKALEALHKSEVDELIALWAERKEKDFNHPSGELLNTNKVIDHLLAQCRFTEAEKLQKEYDQKKEESAALQQQKRQQAYDDALSTLIQKQITGIEIFEKMAKVKRDGLATQRATEREAIEKRYLKLTVPRVIPSGGGLQGTTARSLSGSCTPSVTIKRGDIEKKDNPILPLPQLNFRQTEADKMRKAKRPGI